MTPFTRRHFESLADAVAHADHCRSLRIVCPSTDLRDNGAGFRALRGLKRLYIQGDIVLYQTFFVLPEEIGKLPHLESLVLLNLNLEQFPDWIFDLRNLRSLMVRGHELTRIPGRIAELTHLRSLRIENCPSDVLPPELATMTTLRHLGLCDTRLGTLRPEMLPPKLRTLDFSGTGVYDPRELAFLKQAMPRTRISP